MAKHFKDPEFLKQLDQTRRHRGQKTMTVHEVSSHCTREDLFIIVDNVVYDVTKFQKEHPGGVLSILEVAGKEATEVFLAENHSRYAVVSKLSQCYIADLDTRGVKMSETDPATGEPQSNQTITEPNASPSLPPSCPDVKRLSATAVNKIFSDHAEMFALPGMAWLVREHGCSSMVGACGVRSKKLAGAEGAEEEQRGSEGRKEGGNQASEEAALSGEEVFHWGSCSKALTATLILILIQDPSVPLEWETQVGHALPQLALPPDMAAITVRQLLTHRSGLHADLGGAGADDGNAGKRAEEALSKTTAGLSPTQSRVEYVKMMAKIELAHVPGSRYGPYSNAGYTILGAVAEAVTGDVWEELVQVRVAKPLGMGSLGFGFPRGEIRAHDEEGVPAPAEAEDVPWHAPAYTCHATLSDWDKFARVHLAALRGEPGAGEELGLQEDALRMIQAPASPAVEGEGFDGPEGPEGYAMGWKTEWREGEGTGVGKPTGVLWHYGTNFYFNSAQYLDATRGLVVLVASNSGSMTARLAMRLAIDALLALLDAAAHPP